ncbi:MAG: TraR/DksA C4-type zinc finger protein [Patescibacteria group bacterium]|nr:TraR/DksA C4-type zinc finger protein [Patescibacteria group bacterium]
MPVVNKEDVLGKETIEKIKNDLLIRKKNIEEELADLSGENGLKTSQKVKFPDFGDKTDENAQEIGEYSTNLATEKVLHSSLRDINNALDRIKKGTYGICKYCHESIGKKRMLARPVASACVKCKIKLQSAV